MNDIVSKSKDLILILDINSTIATCQITHSRELGRQQQWQGHQQNVASGSNAAMYAHISDQPRGPSVHT
jgi:hypothetical protein